MPTGVVSWFDPKTGEARIRAGSREFATNASHMESAARRAGARVHFDIHRDGGVEEARDVRLRAGRRNSPHHRRAGTLVGARRPDTKGPSPVEAFHLAKGLALETHPLAVGDAWGNAVAEADLEYALGFYAPDAVVHAGESGEEVSGRRHLQRLLSELPVHGRRQAPRVRGDGDDVLLEWDPVAPDDTGFTVRMRVAHGEIVEQWVGAAAAPPSGTVTESPQGEVPIVVTADDNIPRDAVDRATQSLMALTELFDDPLLLVRLKLSMARDPARERPAEARATFDVNGHLVRAHVAAPTLNEAIDQLVDRMRDKLHHLAERRESLRRRIEPPPPGEWRHGDLATIRPPYFDRPVEERELIRHKVFVADELTAEEAAFDMDQLDHDFHLFRDIATGEDSLLIRTESGYRVRHLRSTPDHGAHAEGPGLQIEEDPLAAPVLDAAEAAELLDASGDRFVFFADRTTGRGSVIYHRYDGHYGLVTLADDV